ncbi:MAG TPA: sensor histidine kinase [Candidatus Krumholzibacteria bacterium]|nr:sensor histidine kinase [Candidatus Krumholzibacteria bacterium]HRX51261.1 sensor histidine kinase [Candidatus Krumholzibacteria bacterium]
MASDRPPADAPRVRELTAELRRLSAELCLTEARERRIIAEELHDHVGQSLALIKRKVARLRGDAVFSGLEQGLDEIADLLDRTIRATRELTGEISPPVLYELGLSDGLDWLAEWCGDKLDLTVEYRTAGPPPDVPEEARVMLFKSARELLRNVKRHAGVDRAALTLTSRPDGVEIRVDDAGAGFHPEGRVRPLDGGGFGLFSIRERMRQLGGEAVLTSAPGAGTRAVLRLPLTRVAAP